MSTHFTEDKLSNGHHTATMWQEVSDGVPEPALYLRTYENAAETKPLIEIKQGPGSILINGETVEPLFKLLRSWLKAKPKHDHA